MFTALKKLVNHDRPLGEDEFGGTNKNGHHTGVNVPMGQHLQRKFARGVQYNSKLTDRLLRN